MPGKPRSSSGPRVRVHVSLDPDLAAWMQDRIDARRFGSVSHAIEVALLKLQGEEG